MFGRLPRIESPPSSKISVRPLSNDDLIEWAEDQSETTDNVQGFGSLVPSSEIRRFPWEMLGYGVYWQYHGQIEFIEKLPTKVE